MTALLPMQTLLELEILRCVDEQIAVQMHPVHAEYTHSITQVWPLYGIRACKRRRVCASIASQHLEPPIKHIAARVRTVYKQH